MPSESTIKQYEARMKKLEADGVDAVENPKSLVDWFDAHNHGGSARKLYLSAIKYFAKDKFPAVLQEMINELYQAQNKKDLEQVLSKKQQENFVKWNDILAVQKQLAEMAEKTEIQWKQFVVASLYTLNSPVRADYGEMKVFPRANAKRTGNELIWNKKPVFVFRNYKTAKTYGAVTLPISGALVRVLKQWFDHLGGVPEYLLGSPTNDKLFAVFVANTFKKYTGKDVGVSLLRHSYITHIFPSLKTIQQKEDVARRMLHSRDLQEKYLSLQDME